MDALVARLAQGRALACPDVALATASPRGHGQHPPGVVLVAMNTMEAPEEVLEIELAPTSAVLGVWLGSEKVGLPLSHRDVA